VSLTVVSIAETADASGAYRAAFITKAEALLTWPLAGANPVCVRD